MNIKDALDLDIPMIFGTDEDFQATPEMNYVFKQLDNSVRTEWGVSQFVIINDEWDKVVKIPFSGGYAYHYIDLGDSEEEYEEFEEWSRDYCEYSVNIYNAAKKKGIAKIFAETKLLGKTVNGVKIYTQEKIDSPYAKKDIEYNEDSLTIVKNKRIYNRAYNRFCSNWLAKAIDCYGEVLVDKFINFCIEADINDTHNNNYGYRKDGSPVIFDYASFDE